jgi:hypothetical protein
MGFEDIENLARSRAGVGRREHSDEGGGAVAQRFSQYDSFTRNVFAGCSRIKSRTSPVKSCVPCVGREP